MGLRQTERGRSDRGDGDRPGEPPENAAQSHLRHPQQIRDVSGMVSLHCIGLGPEWGRNWEWDQ